jgi:SPP1 family predicted phage head-tail adaptor
MRAGKLRTRVFIDEPVPTQNATGELVMTWATKPKVWARFDPLSGREVALMAAQGVSMTITKITVRWSVALSGITSSWRLRCGSTFYNIKSVVNTNNANRELVLLCESGANTG